MDVMPTAAGSARVTSAVCSVSGARSARAPTKRSLLSTASMRARSSRSPSMVTFMALCWVATSASGIWPEAMSPAAAPAMVASTRTGKTLLVPVEMGIRGGSGQPSAKARLVPSPPSVSTTSQPSARSARAALMVSRALAVSVVATGLRTKGSRTSSRAVRTMP